MVGLIKEMPEYKAYRALRLKEERKVGEPQSPEPEDRTLSKRRWEYVIQQWRSQVKQWAADAGAIDATLLLAPNPEED